MIDIQDGRPRGSYHRAGKEFERAVLNSTKNEFLAHAKRRTSGLRDPKTGALPGFRIKGNRLDQLSVGIIGSEELVRLIEGRRVPASPRMGVFLRRSVPATVNSGCVPE